MNPFPSWPPLNTYKTLILPVGAVSAASSCGQATEHAQHGPENAQGKLAAEHRSILRVRGRVAVPSPIHTRLNPGGACHESGLALEESQADGWTPGYPSHAEAQHLTGCRPVSARAQVEAVSAKGAACLTDKLRMPRLSEPAKRPIRPPVNGKKGSPRTFLAAAQVCLCLALGGCSESEHGAGVCRSRKCEARASWLACQSLGESDLPGVQRVSHATLEPGGGRPGLSSCGRRELVARES